MYLFILMEFGYGLGSIRVKIRHKFMGRQLLVLSPKTVVDSGNTGRLLSKYLGTEVSKDY